MPTTGQQKRFCIINPNGGKITIRLLAHDALRAGADFKVQESVDTAPRERWKMAAGDTGESDHELDTSPDALDQNILAWGILVCSFVPSIDSGMVEIQVLQNGVTCPCTKPAQWHLENVPECSTNEQDSIKGNLTFIAH